MAAPGPPTDLPLLLSSLPSTRTSFSPHLFFSLLVLIQPTGPCSCSSPTFCHSLSSSLLSTYSTVLIQTGNPKVPCQRTTSFLCFLLQDRFYFDYHLILLYLDLYLTHTRLLFCKYPNGKLRGHLFDPNLNTFVLHHLKRATRNRNSNDISSRLSHLLST
ncbi:hypothetical protein HDV64DRAFT_162760 [Trichoderma sp. TUCIM 5745]